MLEVNFRELDSIEDSDLTYAVIVSRYQGKWILCKHRDRDTWEIPGGTHESGESCIETAARELAEETGATEFDLRQVCIYSVTGSDTRYGLLCFAEVESLGPLPEKEIERVDFFDELPKNLTYPAIQPYLFRQVCEQVKSGS